MAVSRIRSEVQPEVRTPKGNSRPQKQQQMLVSELKVDWDVPLKNLLSKRQPLAVRSQKEKLKKHSVGTDGILTPGKWILAMHATGHLVLLDVRQQYGEAVFRRAVQELLLRLAPEDIPGRQELAPEVVRHIRVNLPVFYRVMALKPAAEASRLLDTIMVPGTAGTGSRSRILSVPAAVSFLPMIALLAARPDLEYTLILQADPETAERFRQALKLTVQRSKLRLNPFDLPNFKMLSQTDESAVRRLVAQSLSKTQAATAVVSTRTEILDSLNAVPNLALVWVKNPLRQRDASLLTAAFVDELVNSGRTRYDDASLAEQVSSSRALLLESAALQAFLMAA